MSQKDKKDKILLIKMIVTLVIILIIAFFISNKTYNSVDDAELLTEGSKYIQIGESKIRLEIADNREERIKGLSGRNSLDEDTGLLFIFETEDLHGIWMKDMNFSIDIIWFDANKEIVHIEKDVSPDTYPRVYYPKNNSKYVLEIAAKKAEELKLDIGQKVDF